MSIKKIIFLGVCLALTAVIGFAQSKPAGTEQFVKLTYVLPSPLADMSRQKAVKAHLNKYLKDKLNCEIHFIFVAPDQYVSKINLMTAAGESFDLMMGNNSVTKLTELVSRKQIVQLDSLLDKYGAGIKAKVEGRFWPSVKFDGKTMAIPIPFVNSQPRGLAYNKALADKYKFDTSKVKQLKDIEPFLKAVKAGEPGVIPIYPDHNTFMYNGKEDMLLDFISYDTGTNKITALIDDPNYLTKSALMDKWYKLGYIQADIPTLVNNAGVGTTSLTAMQSGKYAAGPDAGASDPTAEKSTKIYGYPTYETTMYAGVIGTNAATICGTAISATSKNPERAMMFVNLLFTDRWFFNEVCFGQEGVDYTVVTPAKGNETPVYKTADPMKWAIWHPWIGPLWDEYGGAWNSKQGLIDLKKGNDAARVSPILGFTYNSESLKKEIAQLTNIWNERRVLLFTGASGDVAKYITETKSRLQTAGLDKVIADMDKQLAAWKTENKK
jgi:putative aldouronate transport system substrate-binding protein